MAGAPSRAQVMHDKDLKTSGGLSKKDLKVDKKDGEIKSKAASKAAKKASVKKGSWIDSVMKARKKLKIKGFEPLTKDSKLYKEAKKIFDCSK